MQYVVFDLEATCWKDEPEKQSEIIEIGAVKLDESRHITGEFQTFVRPKLHPVLSDFAKKLTTISQVEVDTALTFPRALRGFLDFVGDPDETLFVSWGYYDRKKIREDCDLHHLDKSWLKHHMSLKHEWAKARGIRPCGMDQALKILHLPLLGTHHRGIDDAKNIAAIFQATYSEVLPAERRR